MMSLDPSRLGSARDVPPRPAAGDGALVGQVAAIAAGDAGAMDDLFASTGALVLSLARRILQDVHEAEEAMLDVYRYVWERARTYDAGRGSVKSWLLAVARSRSLDRVRARTSRSRREGHLPDAGPDEDLADPTAGPDEAMLATERDDTLERALRRLSDAERRVIDLAFFQGLSHAGIAEATGEPLGTIKSQIRRGLIKLHRLVKNLEDER